ncbi:hypothetical protein COU88_03270 [Candidatus Roizmanbacteria bacterium CG10_big_fil_rev_8_21_14_0_10_39_6]|uniref:SpoVT-AbrB domain-containing protein n=1 Tax=Candidatus Roizmanbacteria bacterium CG10_big_fil_rev_8_21_14_0_10_39_6 TaxID=1974853 RepID=A0A2M8KS89_9BACT|nr:MAG: hypothetical protein COU88_03270 [Candidatus Roizmanbacteria bacterium CG10_big_fil_rev_8_21_14_0_10_39_6]
MKMQSFGTTNKKGQLVIPKKFREELGIHEDILLHITIRGGGVYIVPVDESLSGTDSRGIALKVLKKTAGSWKDENGEKLEKNRHVVELRASRNRRKPW